MVNTLVTHKKLKSLGIGCISKVLKNKVKVNFGLYDVKTCSLEQLEVINTDNKQTVSFDEYRNRILKDNSKLNFCIVGNELMEYVGIGWIAKRVVTLSDLDKYPRVV